MKLSTINVTEYKEDSVLGVQSYSNDSDGVKEAHEFFKNAIRENGDSPTEEELERYVEDKYFEEGEYQIFLTESN